MTHPALSSVKRNPSAPFSSHKSSGHDPQSHVHKTDLFHSIFILQVRLTWLITLLGFFWHGVYKLVSHHAALFNNPYCSMLFKQDLRAMHTNPKAAPVSPFRELLSPRSRKMAHRRKSGRKKPILCKSAKYRLCFVSKVLFLITSLSNLQSQWAQTEFWLRDAPAWRFSNMTTSTMLLSSALFLIIPSAATRIW